MPAYISHAIMGEQLYNECNKDERLFKIPIYKEELQGFSLGNDLSLISKKIKIDPQNNNTKEFFLFMVQYIKENNLIENPHVLALLYGHISHYFLDTNTHPLIYYIEKGCKKIGFIEPHNLIEGYISSYLSNKILQKDIMDIKPSYFNQINLSNKEITTLLNTIYGKLYGDYQITKTYRLTLNLMTLLEKITKGKTFTKEEIINITNYNQFLKENNLTNEEITNEHHYLYRHPITGDIQSTSFYELYLKSLEMTKESINVINKYLYLNGNIDDLENLFTNLSYDTGVDCSLGNNFIHIRKKIKRKVKK